MQSKLNQQTHSICSPIRKMSTDKKMIKIHYVRLSLDSFQTSIYIFIHKDFSGPFIKNLRRWNDASTFYSHVNALNWLKKFEVRYLSLTSEFSINTTTSNFLTSRRRRGSESDPLISYVSACASQWICTTNINPVLIAKCNIESSQTGEQVSKLEHDVINMKCNY